MSRATIPPISEESPDDLSAALASGAGPMRDAILGMVQGKLGELGGTSSGYIEALPLSAKLRIQALKGLQTEQDRLQMQFQLECLNLEKKYNTLAQPIYARTNEIVNGLGEAPKKEEIEKGEEVSAKDDPEYRPLLKEIEESEDPKGIPGFWLTVLKNHIGVSTLLTSRDTHALKSLSNIQLSYPSSPGFTLTFHFLPNDFFENEVLEKRYVYADEIGYSGDFVYMDSVGDTIKWKEGMELTRELVERKQKNKNTGQSRSVKKLVPCDSFFDFFDPPVQPKHTDTSSENSSTSTLAEKLSLDYQLGEDFKDKIIPKAVDYFTGKALEWDLGNDDDSEGWNASDTDEESEGEDDLDLEDGVGAK